MHVSLLIGWLSVHRTVYYQILLRSFTSILAAYWGQQRVLWIIQHLLRNQEPIKILGLKIPLLSFIPPLLRWLILLLLHLSFNLLI